MIKVSFILPCYNVAHYITDCLDSIFDADLRQEDYEVICVNDCSTDRTRSIIEDYANKHYNLVLIDHIQNLTAGGARNTGVNAAKGEYIWFVDPDDMIQSNRVDYLYSKAKENQVDVLFFNHVEVDARKTLIKEERTFVNTEVYGGQDYLCRFFPKQLSMLSVVWRSLFKTEFLKKNELLFPIMRKSQDVCFLWKSIMFAQKVASTERIGYIYRNNPHSVGKILFNASIFFCERMLFASEIDSLLKDKRISIADEVKEQIIEAIKWAVNSNLREFKRFPFKQKCVYYEEIKKYQTIIKSLDKYMSKKSKIFFNPIGGKIVWLAKLNILLMMI